MSERIPKDDQIWCYANWGLCWQAIVGQQLVQNFWSEVAIGHLQIGRDPEEICSRLLTLSIFKSFTWRLQAIFIERSVVKALILHGQCYRGIAMSWYDSLNFRRLNHHLCQLIQLRAILNQERINLDHFELWSKTVDNSWEGFFLICLFVRSVIQQTRLNAVETSY